MSDKQDLIKSLPSDPNKRKKLQSLVTELCNLLVQQKDVASQIKDLKDVAKENDSFDPAYLAFLAQLEYDYTYDSEKKRAKIEEAAEKTTELDILFKRGEA